MNGEIYLSIGGMTMRELFFYDANCSLGLPMNGGNSAADAKALLAEMDYYGVDKALVRHLNLDPAGALHTNEDLAALLRADDSGRLTGTWCILPSQCDEIPPPEQFFALFSANKISAITLSPFIHRYVPCRLTLGKILSAATERKVPVLLNAFAGRWPELYDFMAEFPRLTAIYLEKVGKWGSDRNIRPLLETYPNFYFETAGYWVPEGIRDLADKYGAERILYGSGFPQYNHGNGMLQIKHSGLSAEAVAKIAGGNLVNLLKGAQL